MKPLIVANWKCNPASQKEAENLFGSIKKETKKAEVVICPPFVYLPLLKGLVLGAQNCFWEQKGAYTGEVSALMLKDLGCRYVIVGHSERRKYFKEADEIVNKKLKAVLELGLVPILCIGETETERKEGRQEQAVKSQIEKALQGIQKPVVIAYEPVWAIGTGNACSTQEAQKMRIFISEILSGIYGESASRILYGGSVDSKNASSYIKEGGFSGLLVGGASLKPEEFAEILRLI